MLLVILSGGTIAIRSSYYQTIIVKKIVKQLSKQTNANISIGKVDIAFFKKIILNDVLIKDQKSDTLFYTEWVTAKIDTLRFKKHRLTLKELVFENNIINVQRDSSEQFNFTFLLDSLKMESDTSVFWDIKCNSFGFQQSNITFRDDYSKNSNSIFLFDLNLNISDFTNYKDSVQLKINSLDMNDGKNLFLEKLSADVMVGNQEIDIQSINIKSKNSLVEDSNVIIRLKNDSISRQIKPELDFTLKHSKISLLELSEIVPALKGMREKIDFSGRIYGTFDDLKGKDIVLTTRKDTRAVLDFYINGISNPETMYLFLDLKQCATTFTDLSKIRLPNKSKNRYLKFPDSFYGSGSLYYTGNFSGFLSDFVTFGTLNTEIGILETDVSVIPKDEKGVVRIRGEVSTDHFGLGDLLQESKLGNISFNGEIDANYRNSNKTISGFFKGDVPEIEINNYIYKNIQLDGLYIDQMFDGLLSINDPNLKFDFQGQFDLNEFTPEFNFNLQVDRFLPGNLNLSDNFPNAEMAFNMKAKFTGDKVDNLRGVIIVDKGMYQNKNGEFLLNNIQLISVPHDSTKTFTIKSDFFDVEIEGQYYFQDIFQSFRKIAHHFLPAINYQAQKGDRSNVFDYEINIKDINALASIFYPELKFETPFLLYGKVDSEKSDFELAGSIPGIQYSDLWVRNVFIGNKIIDNQYSSTFKFGEVLHRKGMEIYDLTLNAQLADNTTKNAFTWRNSQDSSKISTIKSQSFFSKSDSLNYTNILTEFFSSEVFVADSVWQFSPCTVSIDSSNIEITDFNIFRGTQNLAVNGNISKEESNKLSVDFNDIDLKFITKSIGTRNSFDGMINCSVVATNLYNKPAVLANIAIDSFMFEEYLVGDLNLTSQWDQDNSKINSSLEVIKNNQKRLNAFGYFQPTDGELNYDVTADNLSLKLLKTVIKNNLSNFDGFATGNVKIGGTIEKMELNGALYATDASVTIDYTQGTYTFEDFVYFKSDTIQFDNITIHDIYENTGNFNGVLIHTNFKNMIYDLTVNSPRILALNTTSKNNEQLYGKVFANCKLDIDGQGRTVALKGSATTLKETAVDISMEYESDIQQYDFFEFKKTEEEDISRELFFADKTKSDFSIALTIEATPEAKLQLVYNSRIGDIIKAQGEGILLFEMDKDLNISLSGDYKLTEGDYLFTLQNVLNKRFTIDQGGSIVWSGSPYNAIVNLTAIYKLKASLYDLMVENYLVKDINQRIPVECKILLSEELTNPVIDFEIDFPEADETMVGILQQFINTEEELNKQILSLIVLGKFYTPEYLRGTYESQNPNTIGTTASEVFSNQLSNWLSQISNDVDVGFNYRPGNSITNDEIELALSTQIFNDRVTLNGNIGNNVNPESTNSSQIVGDFDMKVKLVPSGKIQFKAFNRSNNNLIYETAPYTQGIGFSFQEEYNSINELAKKIGTIFKRKK